jgi:hypothetical protein
MRRTTALLSLIFAGCSSQPVADVCDRFHPSRNACVRTQSLQPGVIVAPGVVTTGAPIPAGCERALKEEQGYRPGLFHRRQAN